MLAENLMILNTKTGEREEIFREIPLLLFSETHCKSGARQ